ncbi:CotS family spore coat protein [Halalkalibacterium halodurans]|uniref:CotS family spore coat protein n=1 Tax=Halalkalibacterium halodurans TaxID=86665 RepID=UPI002AA9AD54|nr:CotS family spore coat protein [Halalkalibacterium halodurans]MDY7222858.1 CotS family spore coat protein [Halalkalibacterium halodurans]MDY7242079.1 CotS family spore coat protein [Halalkalibacterium halodurans]MED4080911.1 CotS family spore coat protein [Halalkalibacterium halodurans]MED4085094.1 CotS family spore coat protein [Halalkalibacterium halodurans]MED4105328.1 CotS family spore coat protein [Halalkalibacterium halodurans]
MEQERPQIITPWDLDGTLGENYVPDYIHEMAQDVLTHYEFQANGLEVITTKADKGGLIWKMETDQGPKSLKILHRRPSRSWFSLGAQEYLVKEKQARVPEIIRTKTGELAVEKGEKLWFVAEWIEPLFQVTKDLEGAKQLCHAIGEFHQLSKGYVPPDRAETASRIYRWPKTYQKIVKKMTWFKNIANLYPELAASQLILQVIDRFEAQAIDALQRLEQSSYHEMSAKGNEAWGLAHQDYGWSNGQMGPNGMWIIDLDGVAYDLPIRDLQKLITGTMDDLGGWDISWVKEMMTAYHEAHPIDDQLYELLLIDLSLPNLFYKNAKELVYDPELVMNQEFETMINRIVAIDETKWPVIEELKAFRVGGSE